MPISDLDLRTGLANTLFETAYEDMGPLERGKVRDSYLWPGQRAIIATDRLSVFDAILTTIPFKGQMLNGISAYWFEHTADICANHLLAVPDPCVSVVRECRPFPVELIVRGYLTGSSSTSIWTRYEAGDRMYCGHRLPDGLRKHEALTTPLVTPTTKAPAGEHDELISGEEAMARGLVSAEHYGVIAELALELFARGQALAAEQGLILVDTKYEFGLAEDGQVTLIDEVHTPDSSRYWYRDGYQSAMSRGEDPRALDKEYVRRLLSARGYRGEGVPPKLSDEERMEVARRYAETFRIVTGRDFIPDTRAPQDRVHQSLVKARNATEA